MIVRFLKLKMKAVGALLLVAALSPAANANTLFGDPGGFRSALSDNGVDLTLFYVNQFATNASGGTSTEAIYSDMFFFGLDLDFEKTPFKIPGGSFHVTFTNRNGENLGAEANLGINLLVNEVFGQGSITRLNHFFYEQSLFENRFVLKFGRVNGSFDFFPFACEFQNLTFCSAIPSYITPNYTPFPGHTWGIMGTLNPTDKIYLKAGLFEINPEFDDPDNGLNFLPVGDGLGTRTQFEAGYTLEPGNGLSGTYRVGFFFDDVGAPDVVTGVNTESQSGFYFLLEQDLWRDPNNEARSIRLFASHTQGDEDTTTLESVSEVGLWFNGPFKRRAQDSIGVAIGTIRNNDRLTELDIANGDPVRESERNFEIYYKANIGRGLFLQPNFQIVNNPGGLSENDDVTVFGLKSVLVF